MDDVADAVGKRGQSIRHEVDGAVVEVIRVYPFTRDVRVRWKEVSVERHQAVVDRRRPKTVKRDFPRGPSEDGNGRSGVDDSHKGDRDLAGDGRPPDDQRRHRRATQQRYANCPAYHALTTLRPAWVGRICLSTHRILGQPFTPTFPS